MLPSLTALPRWVNALSINVIRFGFLDPFEKLQKATICFLLSVSLSVRPHGATRLLMDGFYGNLKFGHFSKICLENSSFIKLGQE